MADAVKVDPAKAGNAVIAATLFGIVKQLADAGLLDVDKLASTTELFVGELGKQEPVATALESINGVVRSLKPVQEKSDG